MKCFVSIAEFRSFGGVYRVRLSKGKLSLLSSSSMSPSNASSTQVEFSPLSATVMEGSTPSNCGEAALSEPIDAHQSEISASCRHLVLYAPLERCSYIQVKTLAPS